MRRGRGTEPKRNESKEAHKTGKATRNLSPPIPSFHPSATRGSGSSHSHAHTMASTPRTPAPERSPPPVPTPPPPLEDEPPPYLADGSPREEASFSSDGREGAPPKNPQLSPTHHAAPRLVPPPSSPARQDGQEQEGSANKAAAATAEPAREPLRQMATGLARPLSSQTSPATTNSPTPSASPTPSSPAPVANNSKRSGQSTPKRAETKLPLSSPAVAVHFDPVEEAVTSPLRLGKARLDQQQQQQHAAGAAESGASVVPGVAAAVAAVAERRELLLALRLATAVLSLAAFSVIASARTSGWAGDYYARHLQYSGRRQVRRRSERDRVRLLGRAVIGQNPPPGLTQVYVPDHVELLLQPVPGPGKFWRTSSCRRRRRPRRATTCGCPGSARTPSSGRSPAPCGCPSSRSWCSL
ncbi:CASP-like protein 4U1 isoform X3 [Zea mays]|uniref:CASP-like protein 4U1 isoform X3 n=1 Tax=Zea mays TaxID=4577 RepID=UPI0004DEAF53|nr:CASP-like protein 4U1 isoform X3 [Zea mays]|eukprot:XP_008655121.1 CASP-like protein 4U1 isoform X3 [Zea mays]